MDVAYPSSDSLHVRAHDCLGSGNPLTCPLYREQALRRRARAASARPEPIRLGQVSHRRDNRQRVVGTLRIHMAVYGCMLLFESIGIYTAYPYFDQ